MASYGCLYCPDTFATVTDHLVHVSTAHLDRIGIGRAAGSRRPFSCRSCAADLSPDATACACGWIVPAGATKLLTANRP